MTVTVQLLDDNICVQTQRLVIEFTTEHAAVLKTNRNAFRKKAGRSVLQIAHLNDIRTRSHDDPKFPTATP